MSFIRAALKTAVAAKVIEIVQREARKPENQRKAKEVLTRLADRRKGGARG